MDKDKTVKVGVYIVIDVDIDKYAAEYGDEWTAKEVRDQIKSDARQHVAEGFAHLSGAVFVR